MRNFKDRAEAGEKLAEAIKGYLGTNDFTDYVALGLPRGGVPVAYEVARRLEIPLDVVVSRKVGAPFNPEFAIGAISENGAFYFDEPVIRSLGISEEKLKELIEDERKELSRRVKKYREGKELPPLKDKKVLLIDDGLATGATALAAIGFLNSIDTSGIIFAAPVCAYDSSLEVEKSVDDLICVLCPKDLSAIGAYYQNFGQTSDDQVLNLLEKSRRLICVDQG